MGVNTTVNRDVIAEIYCMYYIVSLTLYLYSLTSSLLSCLIVQAQLKIQQIFTPQLVRLIIAYDNSKLITECNYQVVLKLKEMTQ